MLIYRNIVRRPNRLEEVKDEKYHLDFAKWATSVATGWEHQRFLAKTAVNWKFYENEQWIFDEDLSSFFLDEDGGVRNRIRITRNLIRPMVTMLEGNAIRTSYNYRVKSIDPRIVSRREMEISRSKAFTQIAKAFPRWKQTIEDRVATGTPDEIEQEHKTVSDKFELNINRLVSSIKRRVNTDEIKKQLSKQIALSGIGIVFPYEKNGHFYSDVIDSRYYLRDPDAKKQDLSDVEFEGYWGYMDAPAIYERWKPNDEIREKIESSLDSDSSISYGVLGSELMSGSGRVPVITMFWKDTEEEEWGWVVDEDGDIIYREINCDDSEYTDRDLASKKKLTKEQLEKTGGDVKICLYPENWRYCVFIPSEFIGYTSGQEIVLDYGECEYQEEDQMDPSSMSTPMKKYCWAYNEGHIMSPIDDVIDPQRLINRYLSVQESHLNNSHGEGAVINAGSLDPKYGGEEGARRAINSGSPVIIDGDAVGGVQNAIGSYRSNIGAGLSEISNAVTTLHQGMQQTTGINEAMTGTSGGSEALGVVLKQQMAQGLLMQESFYWALSAVMQQLFSSMTNLGKSIYAENPEVLSSMVGEDGVPIMQITKEDSIERMACYIERIADDRIEKMSADQLLFQLLSAEMILPETFSELFGNSSIDDVTSAMRRDVPMIQKSKKMAAEARSAAEQSMMAAQEDQRQFDNMINSGKIEADLQKSALKEETKRVVNENSNNVKKELNGIQ